MKNTITRKRRKVISVKDLKDVKFLTRKKNKGTSKAFFM